MGPIRPAVFNARHHMTETLNTAPPSQQHASLSTFSSTTAHTPQMLGKLVHIGVDAVLISAFLAGIKRTTGLTCVPPLARNEARAGTGN